MSGKSGRTQSIPLPSLTRKEKEIILAKQRIQKILMEILSRPNLFEMVYSERHADSSVMAFLVSLSEDYEMVVVGRINGVSQIEFYCNLPPKIMAGILDNAPEYSDMVYNFMIHLDMNDLMIRVSQCETLQKAENQSEEEFNIEKKLHEQAKNLVDWLVSLIEK